MKKLSKMLLLGSLLLTVWACKKEVTVIDPGKETEALKGFTVTKIADKHLELQTPETWLYINPEGTQELLDSVFAMIDEGTFTQEVIDEIKKGQIVMFLEMVNGTQPTGRNLTIIETYVGAATQNDLPSLADYMEADYLQLGESQGLKGIAWVEHPLVVSLGSNSFMVMAVRYSIMGQESVVYQGISINRGNTYTFTYTVNSAEHSVETQELFEKILSTVIFD